MGGARGEGVEQWRHELKENGASQKREESGLVSSTVLFAGPLDFLCSSIPRYI